MGRGEAGSEGGRHHQQEPTRRETSRIPQEFGTLIHPSFSWEGLNGPSNNVCGGEKGNSFFFGVKRLPPRMLQLRLSQSHGEMD